jgi:hypothetical protein
MDVEWQPDAIIRVKLNQLKKDFFDYIPKNLDKIESNIPVFYGHVIATLEKSLPEVPDDLHDRFIDSITVQVLEVSKKSNDVAFIEKLFDYSLRNKKKKTGRGLYDIVLGLKMINAGRYADAIEQLKKYRSVDALICPAIAYCYFVLSTQAGGPEETDPIRRPNTMALASREQMIELARLQPPVNRLKDLDVADNPAIDKIYWFMIKQAIDWFPSERIFFKLGLEKSFKDGKRDIQENLLQIAIERFPKDMYFLRELFRMKIENRDAAGVSGVVKQMTQQYPDELEPIYYGLKLSIMTGKIETYYRFRKLALIKNIPNQALLLLDFAFELMIAKQFEAMACLDEIKVKFGVQHYYVTLLEYVAHDFLSDDEKKVKQAKKAMIDSIDEYCLKLLKIKDT